MGRSGLGPRVGVGLASIVVLAGLMAGLVVLGVWLALGWLDDANGEPGSDDVIIFELGIRSDADGRVSVETPACRPADYLVLTVSERDGPTVWEARADRPTPVDELVIGTAPAGFDDEIPLARALAPDTTYDAEFLVGYAEVSGPPTLIGGARASFRPQDLRPGRTWVGRQLVPPAEYQGTACAQSDSG